MLVWSESQTKTYNKRRPLCFEPLTSSQWKRDVPDLLCKGTQDMCTRCRTSKATRWTPLKKPMDGKDGPQSQLNERCSCSHTKTQWDRQTEALHSSTVWRKTGTQCSRHLPDEIDMTLPLLDVWRTLGRNRGSDVSFVALWGVQHWRHKAHFQNVLAVLQKLRHREVLQEMQRRTKNRRHEQWCTS